MPRPTTFATMALAMLAICSLARRSPGQLPAFPGAEGVAQFVTGGRGGDVYIVTSLADSGAGTLRNGIQTAPAGGRTIVFAVGGTIRLAAPLAFNGKSNLTIAGQTAPGGGITLADDMTHVNNSQNVILQFLRFRPGSTHGSSSTDALWVQNSNGVMIDHVTASWGVDETLSATHQSSNVTVQWSMVSQALYNAGHPEADHSFGSLINGGDYSFHHNLYAHNKRRNPNLQNDNRSPRLDWVNNVTYNPRDAYAESSGSYDLNMVANFGVKGPKFANSNNAMMRPDGAGSRIYFSGNHLDLDRDGLLDEAPIGAENFQASAVWTPLAERVPLPQVATTDAVQAYVQVLSRAGATRYRDAVDRRVVRTVFNQQDGHLLTQADWGGWPALPAGAAAADANSDGVPDAWAAAHGFAPGEPLHTTLAPDGYTYLEKYIHSLTPYAFAPANTSQRTVTTSFGRGGDAQINENGGTSAASSGNGAATAINIHWDGASGSTNQAMLLKFDLAGLRPGSIKSARLELTAAAAIAGAHTFKVYGLEHDAAGWDWNEPTVAFDGAPGVVFDGTSRTLGIDARYTANGAAASPTNPPLPISENLLTLGTVTITGAAAGATVTFDQPHLAAFLNLAAYVEGQPMAGLATIIIEQTASASAASFHAKEAGAALAPRLVVEAAGSAAGDFDADADVDGIDFLRWQRGQSPRPLSADDLQDWRAHYGPGSVEPAASTVPEPGARAWAWLTAAGSLGLLRSRHR
jgi:hypothetical protein